MTGQIETTCQTCGKPLQKGASITQWIFDTSKCTCSVAAPSVVQLPYCALCGLVIRTKLGSITHWIFKTPVCECLETGVDKGLLSQEQLPRDDSIAGSPYEFLGVTGSGGVATVFKARNRKLGRHVAIKILQTGLDNSRAVDNFLREAKSASKLQHPNIVTVQDFGQMVDGRKFLVTEWIDGITLADYLQKHGKLSFEATKELFSQVLDGLTHAHNRAVVHRDIKPSNIMLVRGTSGGWTVKIIDFGTAKEIDKDQEKTRAEDMAGSPFYMSPEQATGDTVDARADLYSVGCSMFEALTGRTPFVGKALSVVMRHQLEEAPTLKQASGGLDFPESIEEIIAKLLAKNPSDRYQSANEVKAALQVASSGRRSTFNQVFARAQVQPEGKAGGGVPLILVAGFLILGCIFVLVGSSFLYTFSNTPAPKAVKSAKGKDGSDLNMVLSTPLSDYWYGNDGERRLLPFEQPLSELPPNGVRTLTIGRSYDYRIASLYDYRIASSRKLIEQRFEGITRLKSLSVLAVWDVPMTVEILQSISDVKNLTRLSISDSPLPHETVSIIGVLPKLESLELNTDSLNRSDVVDIPILKKTLVKLALDNNPVGKAETTAYVAELDKLTYLSLNNTGLDDSGVERLTKLSKIENLFIAQADLSPAGIKSLCKFPKLHVLDLSFSKIGDEAAKQLGGLQAVESLKLAGCEKLTDKCVDALCKLKGLRQLDVTRTSISDRGAMLLKNNLPNIQDLKCTSQVEELDEMFLGKQ